MEPAQSQTEKLEKELIQFCVGNMMHQQLQKQLSAQMLTMSGTCCNSKYKDALKTCAVFIESNAKALDLCVDLLKFTADMFEKNKLMNPKLKEIVSLDPSAAQTTSNKRKKDSK